MDLAKFFHYVPKKDTEHEELTVVPKDGWKIPIYIKTEEIKWRGVVLKMPYYPSVFQ